MKQLDLVGQRFGKLLVIEKLHQLRNGHIMFRAICECGNERIANGSDFKRRLTCCGCSNGDVRQRIKYLNRQLYEIWKGMRARCRDKNHKAYPNYGGKGVCVCEEWNKSFIPFYEWCIKNNWQSGMQIDKDIIPKKLGIPALLYSPEMCSIVTPLENNHASSIPKINETIAQAIRISPDTSKVLSNIYGIHSSQILRIKSNKAWRATV